MPLVYGLCGSFLKIADFLGERNKKFQYLASGISSFLFGLLLTIDSYSSSIFFGIILGVFLASKVDTPNLIFGFIMTFLIVIILGFKEPISWLFSVFSLVSFLDEVGHDEFVNLKFGFLFKYRFL